MALTAFFGGGIKREDLIVYLGDGDFLALR
jgi:hypothetical protein